MRIFKRKKINIKSVSIPDFGWTINKKDKDIIQWINDEQTMALSLNFFNIKPDLPNSTEISVLRDFYREQIKVANGGLIQVDFVELKNVSAIKTIFKIQQEPSGMTYLASITIPYDNCSYVIKLQAPELGTTGIRDSAIADKLLKEGLISIGDSGYEGWFEDPYNKDFKVGLLMNRSENVKYDLVFPDHPLSQTRLLLNQIENGISFGKELDKIKGYNK